MAKDWNNNTEWAGAEAVLMYQANGTEQANLGYGDYLVTAQVVSPLGVNFATYDPNVALGMFNYERYGINPPQCRGGTKNCQREIDLAEISRWGWNHVSPPKCPFYGSSGVFDDTILCNGNAQFALQDFTQALGMVNRYDIGTSGVVTLVMKWRPGTVTFQQYAGAPTLADLPTATPNYSWTPEGLSDYIPNTGTEAAPACQRFHLNLWLGNYYNTSWIKLSQYAPHAGPTNGLPVEVVIKNFEFGPFRRLTLPGLPTLPTLPGLPTLPLPPIL